MKDRFWLLSILLTSISLPAPASGEVITIEPHRDNTLYEDPNGGLSNGAGPGLFVGRTATGHVRRALLAFDVLKYIPLGSRINSVSLTVHVSRTRAEPQSIQLHRVFAGWGEGVSGEGRGTGSGAPATAGDATWLHRSFEAELWVRPGGDFEETSSAVSTLGGIGFYTWGSTPQMIADVQGWLDDPTANFGWILIGNESEEAPLPTSKRLDAREFPRAAQRPLLTINFSPPRPCLAVLPGDLNGDCVVDFLDLSQLASDWLMDVRSAPNQGTIHIDGIGAFVFDASQVTRNRPDIFQPGHFSLFDILAHLDLSEEIDLDYRFEDGLNTHVINTINGQGNWWYQAYYDGGWPERNAFRMDHYPYKPAMTIRVYQEQPDTLAKIYSVFAEEILRKAQNAQQIIVPTVIIRDCMFNTRQFSDVVVTAHDLRTDTFVPGTITAIDVILSLTDQGQIDSGLQWYDSVGTAQVARSFWVEKIDQCEASGHCGFVYEEGSLELRRLNHIHIPSDFRVINSPEYEEWFWIQLGPCSE